MKAHLLLFFGTVLLMFEQTSLAQNPGDNLFSGVQVHTINILFPQPDYWDSLTIYYDQDLGQYIPATVIANGAVFDSVGVRFKGHASYTHPNNKKPFRLSFGEYHGNQRWDGVKGIHLNNCWEDPTFMREKLHLDFCRDADIVAPRANYVRLFINDTLFGFYTLVEHVDTRFLDSHFGESEGDLFKSTDARDEHPLSDFKWYGALESDYIARYEMKSDGSLTAWQQLVQLLDTLHHSPLLSWTLPSKVNLNSFYRAMAADNLFGNLDSYSFAGQNFYFYFHNGSRKMEWIVWDAGLSVGGMPPNGGVDDIENLDVEHIISSSERPLLGNIFAMPTLRNEYLRAYCKLVNNYFSPTQISLHIDSIANLIRPYVYEDLRKEYADQNFEDNINFDINVGSGRKPGLKPFLTARQLSVQAQLADLNVSCVLPVGQGEIVINEFMAENDSILDSNGEPEDWIELYNNTSALIDLSGMFLTNDQSQLLMWQFPQNTIIQPKGFLIVWADSDSQQGQTHANFTLPSDGGFIQLSNIDGSLLDSISFGPQAMNRSMSRIPNGIGPFKQGRHSFETDNGASVTNDPVLTTIILPQYIEGINGTNTNRIPFAFRARLSGLLQNATYKYINQVVTSADLSTTNGSGNCIFVLQSGDFVRTSSPSIGTNFGTFTTDETGMFEGWFVTEPTGNVRFTPSRYVFMRIMLNDGAGGTVVTTRLTTSDSVRVVKLDVAANDSCGTGLRCTSSAGAKDFVFAYDNVAGVGRPIAGTFVESDGSENSSTNSYASFYSADVNGVNGVFGIVLPNILPNGIRRFDRHSNATGDVTDSAIDDDGIWSSGSSTINPTGGTSAIVLTDVTLPVQLVSFTGRSIFGRGVRLDWRTISEINNYGFFVQRKLESEPSWLELLQSFVAGHGTTNEPHDYMFTDLSARSATWLYRLRQVDLDGSSHFTEPIAVSISTSVDETVPREFRLEQNFPNPFNPTTTIAFSVEENGQATLTMFNLIGQEVARLFDERAEAGRKYRINFDASAFSSGVYFYRLASGGKVATKRMMIVK